MVIFHCAIPFQNAAATKKFYSDTMGATLIFEVAGKGMMFNWFGHQLAVIYNAQPLPPVTPEQKSFPCHFGLIFTDADAYQQLLARVENNQVKKYREQMRFAGQVNEHRSFYIVDPANNVIELALYTHMNGVFVADKSHESSAQQ